MDPHSETPEHAAAAEAAAAAAEVAGLTVPVHVHVGVMDPLHPHHSHTDPPRDDDTAAAAAAAAHAHQQAQAQAAMTYHEAAHHPDSEAVAVAVAAAEDFVGIATSAEEEHLVHHHRNMEIEHHDEHNHQRQRGGEEAAVEDGADNGIIDDNDMSGHVSKRRRLSDSAGVGHGGVKEEATAVDVDVEDTRPTRSSHAVTGSGTGRRKNASFPPPKKLNQEQWDIMFNRLLAYKDKYGDTLVPKRFVDDPKLGTWVETQRVQYKRCLAHSREVAEARGIIAPGTSDDSTLVPGQDYVIIPSKRLNAERLRRLNEIEFAWSARPGRTSSRRSSAVTGIGIGGSSSAAAAAATNAIVAEVAAAGAPTAVAHASGALAAADVNNDVNPLVPASPSMTAAAATVDAVDIDAANVDAAAVAAAAVADHAMMDTVHVEEHGRHHHQQQESPSLEVSPHQHQHHHQHQEPSAASHELSNETTLDWDDMYERLVAYKERHGDCLVSTRYPEDAQLARWVEEQRMQYKAEADGNGDRKTEVAEPAAAEELLPKSIEPTRVDPLAPMDDTGLEGVAHEAGLGDMDADGNGDGDDSGHVRDEYKHAETSNSVERWKKLDAIGFVWNIRGDNRDEHWDSMLNQLIEYKRAHGDTLVPCKWEPNPRLGKWVESQRYEYTKLLRARDDAAKAASIAAGMSEPPTGDDTTTGAGATAIGDMPDGNKKRATNSRLTEERVASLDSIGFQWKVKNKMKKHYEKQWQDMFQMLLKYREEHGDCMVPRKYPALPKLGSWVHKQRVINRKCQEVRAKQEAGQEVTAADTDLLNRLTAERRQKLEEAGFDWAVKESAPRKRAASSKSRSRARRKRSSAAKTRNSYDLQWDAMFERLRQYKEEKGDCLVPKRFEADKQLGTWVDTQRVQYKKLQKLIAEAEAKGEADNVETGKKVPRVGRLNPERIEKLENLGFTWSLRDDWDKHYQGLVQYHAEHGDCVVPAKYPKNPKLGFWVCAQRQVYKLQMAGKDISALRTAKLTPERIAALNSIGFKWTLRSREALIDIKSRRSSRQRKSIADEKAQPSGVPPAAASTVPTATQGFGAPTANDSEVLPPLPGVDPISVHGAAHTFDIHDGGEAGQSGVTMADSIDDAGCVAGTTAETAQLAEDIAQEIIADVETKNRATTEYV